MMLLAQPTNVATQLLSGIDNVIFMGSLGKKSSLFVLAVRVIFQICALHCDIARAAPLRRHGLSTRARARGGSREALCIRPCLLPR